MLRQGGLLLCLTALGLTVLGLTILGLAALPSRAVAQSMDEPGGYQTDSPPTKPKGDTAPPLPSAPPSPASRPAAPPIAKPPPPAAPAPIVQPSPTLMNRLQEAALETIAPERARRAARDGKASADAWFVAAARSIGSEMGGLVPQYSRMVADHGEAKADGWYVEQARDVSRRYLQSPPAETKGTTW